jgi:hypothetical protein
MEKEREAEPEEQFPFVMAVELETHAPQYASARASR